MAEDRQDQDIRIETLGSSDFKEKLNGQGASLMNNPSVLKNASLMVPNKQHSQDQDENDSDVGSYDRGDDLFDQLNTYHKDHKDDEVSEDDDGEKFNLCYAYTCLFLQSLVLISFNWSRNLISEAYGFSGDHDKEPLYDIRTDIKGLNDDNIGTIIGFWNTITQAPALIIAGGITDKINRKNMIFITGFLGGLATCLNYYALDNGGINVLITMRAINGLFSAFCQPATYSLINDMFPKSQRTKAFFLYQIFGTLADCLKQITVIIINSIGWQWTYVIAGALGMVSSFLGLLIMSEPPNALRNQIMKQGLEDIKKNKYPEKKENIICRILRSYTHGFKSIFTNLSATFCILGIFARIWETATSQSFMTNYYKVYTSIPDSGYIDLYGSLTALAILIGSFSSNIFSVVLITCLGEGNPMTIPYVCIARHFIDIPACALMFLVQDNFYLSVSGYFVQQILAKGWTAPALLMLKSVVQPEVASLSVGIFLLVVNIDYAVSLEVAQYFQSLNPNESGVVGGGYGMLIFKLCAIPAALAIPFFFFAGIFAKKQQNDKINQGLQTQETYFDNIKKQSMFIKNFGRLEIDVGGVNLPELGSAHFDLFFKEQSRGRRTVHQSKTKRQNSLADIKVYNKQKTQDIRKSGTMEDFNISS